MSKLDLRVILVAWGFAAIMTLTAHAQINTAAVTGRVTDPSHAAIPGAHVTAVNESTGFSKTVDTASGGEFKCVFLPIGTYTLTVEAPGFQKLERRGLVLVAGQVLGLDLELMVGNVRQTVTVSGEPPLINTESSNQLLTDANIDVRQLPQAKMDWSQLGNIGAGMRTVPRSGAPSGNATIVMNGITGDGMSLTLDGTNASGTFDGPSIGLYQQPNVINTVNTDAIQEVSVNKGIMPASVGGTLSGNVNLITKGGTNLYHGDGYELNSVAAYNARNQFLTKKPRFTFNQFGGSLGGPLRKDKLFFFGSYEGVRNPGFSAINTNVPSPYLKSISPAIYASFFALFPSVPQPANKPTATNAQYIGSGVAVQNDLNTMGRVDYNISSSNLLTVRYVYSEPEKSSPYVVASDPQVYHCADHMVNANFMHSHGNWTSATRFGYNKIVFNRTDLGFNTNPPAEGVSLSGAFSLSAPEDNHQRGYYATLMDDIHIMYGRHSIQFGASVQRENGEIADYNQGSFSYSNLSDFLNNTPTQLTITFDRPLEGLMADWWGAYVQDDIKATPKLALNVGVRYDIYTVPRNKDGLIYNRGIDPNNPQLGPGFGPYLPAGSVYNGDHNNFQPRFGFAYTLGASRKTVIRGGSGVFVNNSDQYAGLRNDVGQAGGLPFRMTFSRSQLLAANIAYPLPRANFLSALAAMQSAGVVSTSTLPSSRTIPQNYPNPYTIQFMFEVERELGWGSSLSLGYVGNRGLKLIMWQNENLPNRATGIEPVPTFTTFMLVNPIDSSTYHSLQASVKKRFEHGSTFQVNYTYSQNTSYCGGGITGGCYPQDNNDIRADLGPSPLDLRHNFNASYVYELPLSKWTKWHGHVANSLIGGWQLSGIFLAQSGLPFTVANPGSVYPADRADAVWGVSPYLSNYQSTLDYLNPAAFARVPIIKASGASARDGTSHRGGYFYPGMWNLDSRLGKYFRLTERVRLQVHGDLFNTFNHTNLTTIQSSLTAVNFGQLTAATSRSVQIGARLEF